MISRDGRGNVVVTEATARERAAAAPPPRLSRVRCVHCAMPVRGGLARCWSCGLNPSRQLRPDAEQVTASGFSPARSPTEAPPRSTRPTMLVGGGLLLVLVVLVGSVMLVAPADRGQGVRGLASRLRGEQWPRAWLAGASAEFPHLPAQHTVPAGPGLPQGGQALVTTGPGLRMELLVTETSLAGAAPERSGSAEELVAGFTTSVGGRIVQRIPLSMPGASGLDALVDSTAGLARVRAIVVGTTGWLLTVAGPRDAFRRFTSSFLRADSRSVGPLGP